MPLDFVIISIRSSDSASCLMSRRTETYKGEIIMTQQELINSVRAKAEGYFQRGEFFCSEAVIHTINELMGWPFPKEITKLSSAFPIGIGKSGCLCGAVSGGCMALGMAYGRKHGEPMDDRMFPVAAALHDHVKDKIGRASCRVRV